MLVVKHSKLKLKTNVELGQGNLSSPPPRKQLPSNYTFAGGISTPYTLCIEREILKWWLTPSHPIVHLLISPCLQNGKIEPRFQVYILHYVQISRFHKYKTKICGPKIWSFTASLLIVHIREGLLVLLLVLQPLHHTKF